MKLRQNEIILFQGDSITDGNRGRNQDPNHIMGHGYQFIVGAKLHVDNIDKNIQTFNRGISGNRISDLYGRWLEDCINLKPTMLSILIGVNDILHAFEENSGSSPERYEKIYRMLLDEALFHNPDIRIVIMEPFVGKYYGAHEERSGFFHDYVKKLQPICKKLAEEYNAAFVPLQDILDEYQQKTAPQNIIWDGIHPTITGHEIIARRWLSCVSEKFSAKDNI